MSRPEPFPVLLIPGWSDRPRHLEPLRKRFVRAGWAEDGAVSVGFRDRFGSNRAHAREIAAVITETLDRTGRERVDVVAHSMGGIAVRALLSGPEVNPVRRVAFLATPHRGTLSAYFAWGEGADEARPGSAFLRELREEVDVPALALRVPFDTRVIPGGSAKLRGARNRRVFSGHRSILWHAGAFEIVRRFLNGDDDTR